MNVSSTTRRGGVAARLAMILGLLGPLLAGLICVGPIGTAPAQAAVYGSVNARTIINFAIAQRSTLTGAAYVGGAGDRFGGTAGGSWHQNGQDGYAKPSGVPGWDCSGLVYKAFQKAGISVPAGTGGMLTAGNIHRINKADRKPGDLILKSGHVAIFMGDTTGDGVEEVVESTPYYKTEKTGQTVYDPDKDEVVPFWYRAEGVRWVANPYPTYDDTSTATFSYYRVDGVQSAGDSYQPMGYLDSATNLGGGSVKVVGWALDKDKPTTAIQVDFWVVKSTGARVFAGSVMADDYRSDVGATYPGVGNYHGFTKTLSGLSGTIKVEAWGIDPSGPPYALLTGVRTVTVT